MGCARANEVLHAPQIEKEVRAFSRSSGDVRSCIVVGGVNMSEQRADLKQVIYIQETTSA